MEGADYQSPNRNASYCWHGCTVEVDELNGLETKIVSLTPVQSVDGSNP